MIDGTEEWRSVPGYDRRYQVSSLGRVRSCLNGKHRVLTPQNNRGYRTIKLGRGHVTCYLHKVVALAFLGPKPEGLEIDHIDGDRANNRVDNLRYLTHAQNMVAHRERQHFCRRNHPYDGNEYWYNGRRSCRACARENDNARNAKKINLRQLVAVNLIAEDIPSLIGVL